MHYFLGLEAWKKPGEIFLTQGNYAMDILQRFGMQDCKSMSVPMTTNLTKLRDSASSSQSVDSTLYHSGKNWHWQKIDEGPENIFSATSANHGKH